MLSEESDWSSFSEGYVKAETAGDSGGKLAVGQAVSEVSDRAIPDDM